MSNEAFEVGEIAVFQNAIREFHRNGKECEIVRGFGLHMWKDHVTGELGQAYCYVVKFPGDLSLSCALPNQLRKKRPPRREDHQTTTWDNCAWRPEGVAA